MVLERIREFSASLPDDEAFGRFLRRSVSAQLPVVDAAGDFVTAVAAARELLRAQLPQSRAILGGKLDTISRVGGQLAVDAGKAATLDDGIVLFHEEISRDKPSLRSIFRKSDRRAGRRPPEKISAPQKVARLAVKAGMVQRNKLGQILGLTPAGRRLVKREQSRASSARRKATIKKQERFAAQLRRLK